jgi:hypothetical protein
MLNIEISYAVFNALVRREATSYAGANEGGITYLIADGVYVWHNADTGEYFLTFDDVEIGAGTVWAKLVA